MGYDAPFAGLKVVDLSQGIAGPYCAMLLAQHGADVIKVEGLGDGDWARTLGARYGSHSAFSIIGNLGKRSIAVDLKTDAGKDVVCAEGRRRLPRRLPAAGHPSPRLRLRKGRRPRTPPALRLDLGLRPERAARRTPGDGSGAAGLYRADGGKPRRRRRPAPRAGDRGRHVDRTLCLQALSAALYARRDETRGRYIDVSLMQAAAGLQSIRLMATYLEGGPMKPGGQPAGVFQTADGWMTVLALNDRDWKALCEAMELPELAADPRFANAQLRLANDVPLYAVMRPALAARSSDEWGRRFTKARLMRERLNSYADFLSQPHVQESGLIQWLAQAGLNRPVPVPALPGMLPQLDGTPRGTAPVTGQHTAEILQQHGYSHAEVDSLIAKGIVAVSA